MLTGCSMFSMSEKHSAKQWNDGRVKYEILSAMEEVPGEWLNRREEADKSLIQFAVRILRKKGAERDQVLRCLGEMIDSDDTEFFILKLNAQITRATNLAARRIVTEDFDSFDLYFEAFRQFMVKELKKDYRNPFFETDFFREKVAELRAEALQMWIKSREQRQRARSKAEEIQYEKVERVERHRLKRLAEEETHAKAAAEEALKRRSEAARLEREQRKAENRMRAEQASERARERAEAKRAEWLAAHPRRKRK